MNRFYILVFIWVFILTGNLLYAQHGRSMNHMPGNIIHQHPRVNIPLHVNPPVNNIKSHANSNSIYGTGNYNKKNTSGDQSNTRVKEKDKEDKQGKDNKKKKNKKKK